MTYKIRHARKISMCLLVLNLIKTFDAEEKARNLIY